MHNLNSNISSHKTAEEIYVGPSTPLSLSTSFYEEGITLTCTSYILNAYHSYQFNKMGEIVQAHVDSDRYDG